MTTTARRGKLGYEDVEFGLSTFVRRGPSGALETLNQIRASHLPIRDIGSLFDAWNVEGALIELATSLQTGMAVPKMTGGFYTALWEYEYTAACSIEKNIEEAFSELVDEIACVPDLRLHKFAEEFTALWETQYAAGCRLADNIKGYVDTAAGGTLDHGLLAGLVDDDHSKYPLVTNFEATRAALATAWQDLTDGGASVAHKHDHGGMDGLGDDDHAIYIKADGTRFFTGDVYINEAVLRVIAPEATAAQIILWADQGDDNPDKWRLSAEDGDGLHLQSWASGAWVTVLELNSTGITAVGCIKDEGNMASDSAIHLATQQSIKAYVDLHILHSLATAVNDFLVASGAGTFVKRTLAETGAILEGDMQHDNLQGFAGNEHIDHTAVSVIAGTLLTGGGTIAADRTLNVDEASVDHGSIAGLGDDDHTQYIRHALAAAVNDFLVASGAGTFVKKTLAETGAILEGDLDHGNIQGLGDDDHALYPLVTNFEATRAALAIAWDDLTDGGASAAHKHDHGGQDGLADDDHSKYPLITNFEADRATIAVNWTDLTDGGPTVLHTHAAAALPAPAIFAHAITADYAAAAGAWTDIHIDTEFNGSAWSSLAANVITLAAGTYYLKVYQQTNMGHNESIRLRWYNSSDASEITRSAQAVGVNGISGVLSIEYVFTIAAQKDFKLQYYANGAQPNGLGEWTNLDGSGNPVYPTTITLFQTT